MKKFLAAITLIGSVAASQATMVIDFNTTMAGGMPDAHVATLTLTDLGSGVIKFDLNADWSTATFGTSAFISVLGLNASPTPSTVTDAAGGAIATADGSTNSGSITTNYTVKFPTSGMSGGALRLTNGETATWKTSAAGLTLASFNDIEKVHLQGITGYADTSAWYSAEPVPEPGTMIALGAGALGLIRRRNKKA